VLAGRGCRDGLSEERPGLARARHRWFQPAPMDPPQGTVEPLSQDGGTSGNKSLRNLKTLHGRGGIGEKRVFIKLI